MAVYKEALEQIFCVPTAEVKNSDYQYTKNLSQDQLLQLWNDLSAISGQIEDANVALAVRGFLKYCLSAQTTFQETAQVGRTAYLYPTL